MDGDFVVRVRRQVVTGRVAEMEQQLTIAPRDPDHVARISLVQHDHAHADIAGPDADGLAGHGAGRRRTRRRERYGLD
jgi:hypothetical protein